MGKQIKVGVNDLASQRPELLKSWVSNKNLPMTPDQVGIGSSQHVWWKCDKDHEWKSMISNRAKGVGCPICAGKKVLYGYNDLETRNPTLAKEWHPTKNTDLSPKTIVSASNLPVWWICDKGHEWEISPNGRRGRGCPFCGNKRVQIGQNDLLTTNPELAAQFHPHRNGELSPETLVSGSNKRVWWICQQGHEWENSVNNRNKGQGCPFCSGRNAVKGKNDLQTLSPSLAKEWVIERNLPLKLSEISGKSGKRVWWECSKNHQYQAIVQDRFNGGGCPYCSGHRVLIGFNDLLHLKPELASQLALNASPYEDGSRVTLGSSKKLSWVCSEGHEYKSSVHKRVLGHGCPYCSGQRVLIGFNDLLHLKPELASQLSSNAKPYEDGSGVTLGSPKKLSWVCSEGHEYKSSVYKRVQGQGCPYCSNKKVLVGFNDLSSQYPFLALQFHPTKNKDGLASQLAGKSSKKVWWICSEGHEWLTTPAHRILGRGCPTCAVTGFVPTKAGYFYFISHHGLAARKVGIANKGSDRLETFAKAGWSVLAKWNSDDGFLIQELETQILRWIRKDLGLPPYLTKQDMGRSAGWSETFSEEGASNLTVQSKIDEVFATMLNK
jgi:Zn finger protein HypA/HybF involved in hydrogenase expression